jgi:hypothetical protein
MQGVQVIVVWQTVHSKVDMKSLIALNSDKTCHKGNFLDMFLSSKTSLCLQQEKLTGVRQWSEDDKYG